MKCFQTSKASNGRRSPGRRVPVRQQRSPGRLNKLNIHQPRHLKRRVQNIPMRSPNNYALGATSPGEDGLLYEIRMVRGKKEWVHCDRKI
jgi:hypothetical protein